MRPSTLLALAPAFLAGCLDQPSGAEAYFIESTVFADDRVSVTRDGDTARGDGATTVAEAPSVSLSPAEPAAPPEPAGDSGGGGLPPALTTGDGGSLPDPSRLEPVPVSFTPPPDDPSSSFDSLLEPAPPEEGRRVKLVWAAPVVNADGSPLGDLAGFRVYDGPQPRRYTMMTEVGDTTEYTLEALDAGTYFIAVTAYDEHGNESSFSEEIRIDVD